jgi:osmotically-inducible protein OsmY
MGIVLHVTQRLSMAVVATMLVVACSTGVDPGVEDQVARDVAPAVSDAELRDLVQSKLDANPHLESLRITVDVREGVVSLTSGENTTEDQRDLAVLLAKQVRGVSDVVDTMR